MSSLRSEQKRVARERIVLALAEEITAKGVFDLSVPSVAERAGVSLRTVYNYFENREALLNGLSEMAEEVLRRGGGRMVESDPDRMADALQANFRLFSELDEALMRALFVVADARDSGVAPPDRTAQLSDERTAVVRAMVEEERPDLTDEEQAAVAAILRLIASSDTWRRLTGAGLSGERAGQVAAWAFDSLLASIRAGTTPYD